MQIKKQQIENRFKSLAFLKSDSETAQLGYFQNTPIIAVWRISEIHIAFFCRHCSKIHKHGWGDGRPDGSRVSHCNNEESPYYEIEYYLCCQNKEDQE